ncbi:FAD-dependent oxidoreductase [Tistrella sp.]|uniref:FAD-dependent oxidoreductase n=1 Tax=Tistrella sp. TaxID=2024861 RepID=UPI002AC3626E|nr:FAD-dependent oxidoreductase [Tistrella sp.]
MSGVEAGTHPVVVVGAGAAGLTAALAARDAGAPGVVLERDAAPAGNTALTLGMLPGAGTRFQRAAGIEDDAELFLADILAKAKGRTDHDLARAITAASGPAVEWLADRHGVAFELLDDILYPGHSRHRYHVPPGRTGTAFMADLLAAVSRAGVQLITRATVEAPETDAAGRVTGVVWRDEAGGRHHTACRALVLASGGYGADPEAVIRHIPEMAGAVHGGHHGSRGDALRWGERLGAALVDLGGYQGHCVADGPDLPVTWAVIIRGGVQVAADGRRFSNEMRGYSEQAHAVAGQAGGVAWTIYDRRCEEPALTFRDYHRVLASGVVAMGDTVEDLARACGLPAGALAETLAEVEAVTRGHAPDRFGRVFDGTPPLQPPFRAVRVRAALFHTQGGLAIDTRAQVLDRAGRPLPGLFAAGGAARGLSGPAAWGYLGGNGLLTAVVPGRFAGTAAAAC